MEPKETYDDALTRLIFGVNSNIFVKFYNAGRHIRALRNDNDYGVRRWEYFIRLYEEVLWR